MQPTKWMSDKNDFSEVYEIYGDFTYPNDYALSHDFPVFVSAPELLMKIKSKF